MTHSGTRAVFLEEGPVHLQWFSPISGVGYLLQNEEIYQFQLGKGEQAVVSFGAEIGRVRPEMDMQKYDQGFPSFRDLIPFARKVFLLEKKQAYYALLMGSSDLGDYVYRLLQFLDREDVAQEPLPKGASGHILKRTSHESVAVLLSVLSENQFPRVMDNLASQLQNVVFSRRIMQECVINPLKARNETGPIDVIKRIARATTHWSQNARSSAQWLLNMSEQLVSTSGQEVRRALADLKAALPGESRVLSYLQATYEQSESDMKEWYTWLILSGEVDKLLNVTPDPPDEITNVDPRLGRVAKRLTAAQVRWRLRGYSVEFFHPTTYDTRNLVASARTKEISHFAKNHPGYPLPIEVLVRPRGPWVDNPSLSTGAEEFWLSFGLNPTHALERLDVSHHDLVHFASPPTGRVSYRVSNLHSLPLLLPDIGRELRTDDWSMWLEQLRDSRDQTYPNSNLHSPRRVLASNLLAWALQQGLGNLARTAARTLKEIGGPSHAISPFVKLVI